VPHAILISSFAAHLLFPDCLRLQLLFVAAVAIKSVSSTMTKMNLVPMLCTVSINLSRAYGGDRSSKLKAQ